TFQSGRSSFACGSLAAERCSWSCFGQRIFPHAPGSLFFGVPPGDHRWSMPAMPAWIESNRGPVPALCPRGALGSKSLDGVRYTIPSFGLTQICGLPKGPPGLHVKVRAIQGINKSIVPESNQFTRGQENDQTYLLVRTDASIVFLERRQRSTE